MRMIDADALKARLKGCVIILPNGEKCMADRAINTQGTIEAEQERHGRWEFGGFCSECGISNEELRTDYCPNCGAQMDAKDTNVSTKGGADHA